MKKKIIEYGTKLQVDVLSATERLITVFGNGEIYLLVGHGIKELPKVGDLGNITFVKSNSPLNGHWHYEPNEK